jgi:LysR family glycine cleavage system transcriptional activator
MEPVARAEIAAGRLVIPFDTPLRARFAFYLVVPAALAERPAVTAFRHWLLEEARKEPSRLAIGPPVVA